MHPKEYQDVSSLPAPERYAYFIKKTCDWHVVWGLKDQAGWARTRDEQGRELVPVWPHAQFAYACATGPWAGYQRESIDLSAWLQRWIPGMLKDQRSVAIFMTAENKGVIVTPERLRSDLEAELANYEGN